MADIRIAAVIKRRSDEKFLLVPQVPPPALEEEEYQRYSDSNLYDLPTAPLNPLVGDLRPQELIIGGDFLHDSIDLTAFDINSAIAQITSQIERSMAICTTWYASNYIEEPEFGPDLSVNTLFIFGILSVGDEDCSESCMWISEEEIAKLHLLPIPKGDRIGLLAIIGILHGSDKSKKWPPIPQTLIYQEYPLGIKVVPMKSRTPKPFQTTNLVLIVAEDEEIGSEDSVTIKHGDAILIDPGCSAQCHSELEELVKLLPKKLLIFLTHHHYDHIDGLSSIEKCNREAVLLAHANTLQRIEEHNWSLHRLAISGGETIQIGNHKLETIFAPGHTDGHCALLHLNTRSLIAGDHCVGYGSAVLDSTSGGNMEDYFQTTYKFLEISPNSLIPMHGRINLWPERLLCGYLKHRRDREKSILKALKDGAKNVLEIVAGVYSDVDERLWPVASSNVRLHVEHLACQGMLPNGFSLEDFKHSYDVFIKNNLL